MTPRTLAPALIIATLLLGGCSISNVSADENKTISTPPPPVLSTSPIGDGPEVGTPDYVTSDSSGTYAAADPTTPAGALTAFLRAEHDGESAWACSLIDSGLSDEISNCVGWVSQMFADVDLAEMDRVTVDASQVQYFDPSGVLIAPAATPTEEVAPADAEPTEGDPAEGEALEAEPVPEEAAPVHLTPPAGAAKATIPDSALKWPSGQNRLAGQSWNLNLHDDGYWYLDLPTTL